jgi:catechol 2,3-dioxygenase-like lactoylglutathione lyase family enzyme
VRRGAEFTPKPFQRPADGVIISVQVDDVDAVHAAAVKRGLQIAQGLRDQDFGMHHFMIVDPNGLLVNVLAFPEAIAARESVDNIKARSQPCPAWPEGLP